MRPSRRWRPCSPVSSSTPHCSRSRTSSTSNLPTRSGMRQGVAELAAAAGRRLDLPVQRCATLHRAGLVHGLGRLGVSNSIWDKHGPLGAGEWERVRLSPLPHRAHAASVAGARAARGDRCAASRASRRFGLSAGPVRRRDLSAGAHSRRRRRVPGDARTASVPAGAERRRGRRGAARRGSCGTPRRRCGRGGAGRGRSSGRAPSRGAGRAHARARSRCCVCSLGDSRTKEIASS